MSDLRFPDPHPLDAVIWRALTSIQKGLAEGDQRARRYPAAIAPFAATIDMEAASLRSLLALVGSDDRIALFTTEEVEFPSAFTVIRRDSVDQMVFASADARVVEPGAPIVALGAADVTEMLALAGVTKPGPFGARTIELGGYIGIRRRDMLVAMAGERFRRGSRNVQLHNPNSGQGSAPMKKPVGAGLTPCSNGLDLVAGAGFEPAAFRL